MLNEDKNRVYDLWDARTLHGKVPCGKLHIIVNTFPDTGKLARVELHIGKKGVCAYPEAVDKLIEMIAPHYTPHEIMDALKNMSCKSSGNAFFVSCPHAVAIALKKVFDLQEETLISEASVVLETKKEGI